METPWAQVLGEAAEGGFGSTVGCQRLPCTLLLCFSPPGDVSLYLVNGVVPWSEPSRGRLGGGLVWSPFLLGL